MYALVLANGVAPSPLLLERLCSEADLFLATDGAANQLLHLNLVPHIVLGDFDSIAVEARDKFRSTEFIRAVDQEASDLDKALSLLAKRGVKRVTITGSSGGRIDHALTNVSLLLKFGSSLDLRIVEDHGEMRLLDNWVDIEGEEGDTVSIVVFETVRGVTTEGLVWPLVDATLDPGSRGVSNRLAGSSCRISIREGRAVVCHLRQPRIA